MDITKHFINFRKTSQYIYGGENYIEVYKRVEGNFKTTKTFEDKSIFNLGRYDIDEIKRECGDVETGIVLNSGYFIFNIFEFDKIPFKEEMRRDLVNWRLQKVFPEDIELYEHDFFRIDRKKILSVLFKKSLKEKIETVFDEYGMKVIYMGNSTVEIINNIRKWKPVPDFFIEIDKEISIVVFSSKSVPFYIRKFRGNKEADIAREVVKTVNFVKNSYENVPSTYSIINSDSGSAFDAVREELAELNMNEVKVDVKKKVFLPV
ncbi:MAG: hypothetical protein KAT34_13600 [Candidatus Aminicenantes bacterium]|nr:hypothetical protein [Candidatus Aminicenantes bacterium]